MNDGSVLVGDGRLLRFRAVEEAKREQLTDLKPRLQTLRDILPITNRLTRGH